MKRIIKVLLVISILALNFYRTNTVWADDDKYLIVDSKTIMKYQNNKWYISDEYDEERNYEVYIDDKYFGVYKIKAGEKFALYDNNDNKVIYNGILFAYSRNFELENKDFEKRKLTPEEIEDINSQLNMNIIENELTINECVNVDLDNNGANDKIFNISNLDSDNSAKYYSLLIAEMNSTSKQIIINEEISAEKVLLAPRYNIKYVINVDNNKNDNIIVRKSFASDAGETEYLIYNSEVGKYEEKPIENGTILPDVSTSPATNPTKNSTKEKKTIISDDKYALYIFLGIALIVFSIGYLIFSIMKNKQDIIDD